MKSKKSRRPSSYSKLTYIQKIARLNKRIRLGDVKQVAKETGYSPNQVSEVLNGNSYNELLVNKAWDIARNRMANAVKIYKLELDPSEAYSF